MKTLALIFRGIAVLLFLSNTTAWAITESFTNSTTWTCPAGVTNVAVECWGGGGAGGSVTNVGAGVSNTGTTGGGGAGGAYARAVAAVIPGNNYTVTVGVGGIADTTNNVATGDHGDGGDSWFADGTMVLAKGGIGGMSENATRPAQGNGGACPSGSIGEIINLGGNGADGNGAGQIGGGGGGSGGTSSAGNSGNGSIAGAAVSGGGGGGKGNTGNTGLGASGNLPGGGGGAGIASAANASAQGGAGAIGKIAITYTTIYTWTNNSASTWLTTNNWSPNSLPTNNDVAVFDSTTTKGTISIDMTKAGAYSLGEIQLTGGAARTINNSSGTAGTLTLNGNLNDQVSLQNSSTYTLTLTNGGGILNMEFGDKNTLIDIADSGDIVIGSVITGNNGFTKTGTGSGKLVLSGANTYAGDTIINNGTLNLSASGSINNSANILVASGATFDVSANDGFVINSTQTLEGEGMVKGTTTINGVLSPGNLSIGTLTFNDNLVLAGITKLDTDKAATTLTADKVAIANTLTYGGTLTITATGAALNTGDSFTLFTAASFNQSFSSLTLPVLASGLSWDTNKLATTGILDVYSFSTNGIESISSSSNVPVQLLIAKLLAKASSLRGIITLASVSSTSVQGGTVTMGGVRITYNPPMDFVGNDSFTCTLNDGHGSITATVYVTVSNPYDTIGSGSNLTIHGPDDSGQYHLIIAGTAGTNYQLQFSATLNPADWQNQGEAFSMPSEGLTNIEITPNSDSGYFRTIIP